MRYSISTTPQGLPRDNSLAVYVGPPPQMPKQIEIDQTRALVVEFLRELPELMLLVVALAVVGIRRCWIWLQQWR